MNCHPEQRVGWVERSETQHKHRMIRWVSLRSTQPTFIRTPESVYTKLMLGYEYE